MAKIYYLFLVLMLLPIVSCSEQDGVWDSMKWKLDGSKVKECSVSFDSNGGKAVFECTNYGSVWFGSGYQPDGDPNVIEGTWFLAKLDGNKVEIIVEAAVENTVLPREEWLLVTIGDTYSKIHIMQK